MKFVTSLIFVLLVMISLAAGARTVEVQGSAMIEHGLIGKARAEAIQNAVTQAALLGGATVSNQVEMKDHAITHDATRVSTSGEVSNVEVMDTWQTENVIHVRVKADVMPGSDQKQNVHYRKKVAITQFEVLDRSSIQDFPHLEVQYPQLLMRKLLEQEGIVVEDATRHLLSDGLPRKFRRGDMPERSRVIALAGELGAQFVLHGIIHGMPWQQESVGMQRNIVIELQVLDGITGVAIGRYTFADTLWGGDELVSKGQFGTPAFFETELGSKLQNMMNRQVHLVVQDLERMPFSARVIRSEGSRVYFDAGTLSKVSVGDVFMAYRRNENRVNLLNQQNLGVDESASAVLVVRKVQPMFAMGELESGAGQLEPGDIVRLSWE